jgi:hypothetical protein
MDEADMNVVYAIITRHHFKVARSILQNIVQLAARKWKDFRSYKERIMIIYEPFEEDKEFQINVYLTYYVDNEDYDDDCIQEEDMCNG